MMQTSETMATRENLFTMRMSDEERQRLEKIATHYGANGATVVRMLLKEKENALDTEKRKAYRVLHEDQVRTDLIALARLAGPSVHADLGEVRWRILRDGSVAWEVSRGQWLDEQDGDAGLRIPVVRNGQTYYEVDERVISALGLEVAFGGIVFNPRTGKGYDLDNHAAYNPSPAEIRRERAERAKLLAQDARKATKKTTPKK